MREGKEKKRKEKKEREREKGEKITFRKCLVRHFHSGPNPAFFFHQNLRLHMERKTLLIALIYLIFSRTAKNLFNQF